MNEALRMAYLQAMDIDCLVSRRDLPGAKPSQRLALVRRREPAAPVAPPEPAQALRAGIVPPELPVKPAAAPAPAPGAGREQQPAPNDPATDLPIFSLAVTAAGACLWLDQVPPGRSTGSDYLQLIEAICLALELPAGPADVSLFHFPMTDLPQVGRDLAAARDALQGYLERRLEQLKPRAIVLLGDMEEPWFNRHCLGTCPVVTTVSAWQMLRQPNLKRVAWTDLQALHGHGA